MRISTNMIFEMGSRQMSELQAAMARTQQQVASGRRILSPADDPVAAATALGVNQAISINDQFSINRQNVKSALSQEESVLQSVTSLLQSVKDAVVGAGNGSMNDQQRQTYLTQLRSNFDELMGLANTRDPGGNYIFGGYQTNSQPFTQSASGATYNGDQGQRMLQVDTARQLAGSDSGTDVFESGKTGNGRFVTAADAGNNGTGVVSLGSVSDLAQLNGHTYELTFAVDAVTGLTTYQVTETPAPVPPPLPTDLPFVSGQAITIGGMQFDIKGNPADQDTFTVKPSTEQSIFTTINNLIDSLSVTGEGQPGQTRLTNALNTANTNIDKTIDNILTMRTTIGSRLKEVDNLEDSGMDMKLQYQSTLKALQEIDPVEAYSQFTQQQYTLQAAQQSFIKITGLSLFNLLR
ncbi:flagellar hook-associated protein FlgL [Herminiimonas sp. NPDC097707]|uniref:flagellar hook-associated protein FlgL n=1 Tax=Herminiimonas sp. NPDC097707 TaxID=3364007 RepID=UPI00383B0B08